MKKTLIVLLSILAYTSSYAQSSKVSIPNAAEQQQIVERHNYWRSQVNVAGLSWNNDLAKEAAKWGKVIAENCDLEHSDMNYGENLFWSTYPADASTFVDSWASEQKDYNAQTNKCKSGAVCGHYTQIVWRNTTQVGCAMVACKSGYIWVCEYNPSGNWVGQKPY
jgi:pathogenesis-related protein 1